MRAYLPLALVLSSGCAAEAIPTDTVTVTDAGVDSGTTDAGTDAGGMDGGSSGCEFPEPRLGTGAAIQAVATAPARCGQPDHVWLSESRLGDVISRREVATFPTALLRAAFASQGITPARPLVHDVTVDQLLYMTQDRGALIEATAAISYPTAGFADGGPRDILLFLHGTAGFADACAPSNDLTGQALTALFASWGYLVVSPDYLGLKGTGDPSEALHPSAAGQALAIASLDSVRALAKLPAAERGGTCVKPRVLVYGVSQGGQAALWVDRLGPYYAPELELAGVVAAIPPLNMVAQAELSLTSLVPATGFVVSALVSTSPWYGAGDRLSEVLLPPYATEVPAALGLGCTDEEPPAPDFTGLDEFIQPELLNAAAAGSLDTLDPWGCLLTEADAFSTSIPRIAPDPPSYGVLVTLGSDDELVDAAIARAGTQTLCEAGVPLSVVECAGASHTDAGFWSMPEALDFLDARAAGEAFVPGSCAPPAPVSCRGTPAP